MPELYALPPAPPPDEYDGQPPLSQIQRVTNTFVAPTKTFADLRRDTSWWLPFVIILVFSYLFSGVALTKMGAETMSSNAIRNNPAQASKMEEATPEQRAQMVQYGAIGTKVVLLSWIVVVPLFDALFALLLWVGFNFILGGSGTFKGMFAVSIFAGLPGILRSLLVLGVMFIGDLDTFNINEPLGTNPGYYLGPDSSVFLKTLLGSVDLFTLWTLVLMAIGGAIVARVKVKSGVVMVLVTWLLFVLARAGIVAAMS